MIEKQVMGSRVTCIFIAIYLSNPWLQNSEKILLKAAIQMF
jgi:hypothetical protein